MERKLTLNVARKTIWKILRKIIRCYETPKREKVSCAFEHLIQNLKSYNGVKI